MLSKRTQRKTQRMRRTLERSKHMREQRLFLPFVQFVHLMPYMTTETIQQLILIPPPREFCRKEIPANLQMVTFGILTQLQQAPKDNDYLRTCCALVSVLTGIDTNRIASKPAIEVIGIVNMIQSEMERIGKLFQSLNVEHSSEEMSAGIDRLNFGVFGIVDWYAKRMGIIDHEEVFATPWARVYQCMRIDHEQGEFEKRYRKIIEQRSKRK